MEEAADRQAKEEEAAAGCANSLKADGEFGERAAAVLADGAAAGLEPGVAAAAAAMNTKGAGRESGDGNSIQRHRNYSHNNFQEDVLSQSEVRVRARKLAASSVTGIKRDDVWGVLTAVSDKAKSRSQGLNITLHNMEHVLGRNVKDLSCQFDSPSVSARHCKISRRIVEADGTIKPTQNNVLGAGEHFLSFVKDTSSNGTYLNHRRLRKDGPEACLQHGDIISLIAAPEHENAFAFVYREVFGSKSSALQPCSKRKGSIVDDSKDGASLGGPKRLRGLSIGGSDGPVSLDDVRRLQRANEELRQQLEAHLLTIEKMRNEFRAAEARHDTELKELQVSVTTIFSKQIEDIRSDLIQKNKELESYMAISIQQQSMIEDLNQHIAAAAKSRLEAEEAIKNHKGSIAELENRLEDERTRSQMEREASEANFRVSLERARQEAAEEMRRHVEAAARQQKQHLEVITALQEADKDNRSISDNLRVKLEEERCARMDAEKRVRRLETQLSEGKTCAYNLKQRVTQLEQELQKAFRQLDDEKIARENATAKIVTLELEMETAINNLQLEKQRLEGARERIVLRETQLRSFHSTAEEIAALQLKQQEQLKAMLRTLEDGEGENHPHTSSARGGGSRRTNGSGRKNMICEAEDSVGRHSLQKCQIRTHQGILSGEASEKINITSTSSLYHNSQKHHNLGEVKKEENSEYTQAVDAVPSVSHVEVAAAACVQSRTISKHADATLEDEIKCTDVNARTQLIEVEDEDVALPEETMFARNRAQVNICDNDREHVEEENDILDNSAGSEEGGDFYGETMELEGEEDECHAEWEKTQAVPEDYGSTLPMDTCLLEEGNEGTFNHNFNYEVGMIAKSSTSAKSVQRDTLNATGKRICPVVSSRLKGGSVNKTDMHSLCTADLLASEGADSWAASTPMSQHDDNDSCHSDEGIHERLQHNEQGATGVSMEFVVSQVGTIDSERARNQLSESPGRSKAAEINANALGSQNMPSPRLSHKNHLALTEMITIVAPDFEGLHRLVKSLPHASDSEDDSNGDEDDNNKDKDDDTDSTHSNPSSRTPSISNR